MELNIGLYNLEPHIVNSALMRVSQYHKERGDNVERYTHFQHEVYDRIYAFSIFDFTAKDLVRPDMITGGTGFDIESRLPLEIESSQYDWEQYPNSDFSIIWFSTGCIRNCSFCVVPRKEGLTQSTDPKNLNPRGKYIKIMDNNFFTNPKWPSAIEQLRNWDQPVDFQGVDVRLLTRKHCEALMSLRHRKQIHIAWDFPAMDLRPQLEKVVQWMPPSKLMCYVLIGYDSTPEQDMYRIETLRKLKIDPFVMPFDKKDPYQRALTRWVNHKAIFYSVPWAEYKKDESHPASGSMDRWIANA